MDKQVQETYASDDVRSIPLLDRVKELKDDKYFPAKNNKGISRIS